MQALYAYYKKEGNSSIAKSEKELLFSINKAYDLYHYLLLLIIDIADLACSRIDIARNKKIPTYEDLHPNTKFIENKIIVQIRNSNSFMRYLEQNKLNWVKYPELIKGLYNEIIRSGDYINYISNTTSSYKEDKKFICSMYKMVISQYEPLYSNLEEQSIFWNDEIEYILSINIKTIKRLKEEDVDMKLAPLYKSIEDKNFSKILFRKVILNHKEYLDLIEKYSKNWDVNRIAFMDILLMQMAIAEAVEFDSIPVKVTLNEYLELSKYYSTVKSNVFINGILDKAFKQLKETNQINKQGRGLIGEV
ncbi:Transcription antitermination protein NusB [subsurface metagenome]